MCLFGPSWGSLGVPAERGVELAAGRPLWLATGLVVRLVLPWARGLGQVAELGGLAVRLAAGRAVGRLLALAARLAAGPGHGRRMSGGGAAVR